MYTAKKLVFSLLLILANHHFLFSQIKIGAPSSSNPTQRQTATPTQANHPMQEIVSEEQLLKELDQQAVELKKNGIPAAEVEKIIQEAKAEVRKYFSELNKQNKNSKNKAEEIATETTPSSNQDDALAPLAEIPQPLIYEEKPNPYSGIPHTIRFYDDSDMTSTKFRNWIQEKYHIQLLEKPTITDDSDFKTVIYKQVLDGYEIESSRYVFSKLPVTGYFATGMAFDSIIKKNKLSINLNQAFEAVNDLFGNKLQLVKEEKTGLLDTETPRECLLKGTVWKTSSHNNRQEFYLCYLFAVSGSQEKVYVNAETAAIFERVNSSINCLAPVSSPEAINPPETTRIKTKFYGDKDIRTLATDTGYFLADTEISNLVMFYKEGINEEETPIIFQNKDNKWTHPSFSASGALDAFWSFGKIMEYYHQQHRFSAKTINASRIKLLFDPNYVGACFEPNKKYFIYGQISPTDIHNYAQKMKWEGGGRAGWISGSLGSLKPFATLDVLAHEYTHGVIETFVDLKHEGESGALNEGIADVMGAVIESAIDPMGSNEWLMGEKLFIGSGIRNLATPKSSSFGAQPDTFEKQFWIERTQECDKSNDYCGVHINAGVIAKWAYLMVHGGMGENDYQQKYVLKDGAQLSKKEVAKLVYQTLPLLHPTIGFEQFADLTIEMAKNQFGKCSNKAKTVEYAWYAVGVLADPPAKCGDWSLDMVAEGNVGSIKYYFKEDDMVVVIRQPDIAPTKIFTNIRQGTMTFVTLDDDGKPEVHTMPKDILNFAKEKLHEEIPQADNMVQEEFAKRRKEIAMESDPDRKAEMQRDLNTALNIYETVGKKEMDKMKTMFDEAADIPPTEERLFFGATINKSLRKAKQEFDKQYFKKSGKLEGFSARYFESAGQDLKWWSTYEIPLRFSDIMIVLPQTFRNGSSLSFDHFTRGFPLQINNYMKFTNIKNSVPANFEQLRSTALVF